MDEQQLSSVGPSIPPKTSDPRRKTDAWSNSMDMVAAAATGGGTRESTNASPPTPKRTLTRFLALSIVAIQALWAIVVPMKNIATVFYPTTRPDSSRTVAATYAYASEQPQVLTGKDLVPLLNDVLDITLSSYAVSKELEKSGTFDVNQIYNLLSLDELAVVSRYYAVVLQSSEFPAAAFTPRAFSPASKAEKLSLALLPSASADSDSYLSIDLACGKENAFMAASRCTGSDGHPCPADYPQADEVRTFEDIDLRSLGTNSGLHNNVGLLFVVEFFQQAMSAVFASRDWTTALESLNYLQSEHEALTTGSLSSFKDGVPSLLEQDAFLVAVQAAQLQTTQLDSCFASELVVGQFYTRAFVLDMIQKALAKFGYFDSAATTIVVPPNTDAILQPIFAFDVHITSGARFGEVQHIHTSLLKHFQVASQTMLAVQVKLDHDFNAANQVAGSSLRMLQYMAFLPELASVFESKLVQNGETEEYDCQVYKLIGASRSGIDTFKEPSTGANSWMVYPLAELGDAERPNDSWWGEEREYAAWFQSQEANTSTAPFRIFDTHLRISSTMKVTLADDNSSTRCHRALFKVLGKLAYLALVRTSKPASYLMFMSEVSVDHYSWLLNNVFTEELVGESFFGGRVGIPYRNGPYTRKDDGSSWVVVPLLNAMLQYYGSSTTLAYILAEFDRSFADFVKTSDGDLRFPDTVYCHVDGLDAATQTATSSDDVGDIYTKIYSGLEASVADILTLIPDVHARMVSAMTAKGVSIVSLSKEQIVGNSVVTYGPPNDWRMSVFTVGLRKFWPPKTPLKEAVHQMQAASRCYRMLELRYLNTTTRCFAEPNNVRMKRVRYQSEAMRKFLLSNWSMAVMLNTMAWVPVLKYLKKLLKAWEATRFEYLDTEVALQLNLQGIGVLNISQSLLFLVATLPSLIGFHLPNDSTFMPSFSTERPSKPVVDFFVTFSMSWFVKVGFEFCNNRISPRRPVNWYHLFRLRWLVLALIFVLRLATPERVRDGTFLMWRLVVTCVVSLVLGACCTVATFLPEKRGKVVNGSVKSSHDAVLGALVKQNLPLNRYGVIGRTSRGWSTAGLIVEGWKLARSENGDQVLRKGAGEILLPKETHDDSAKVESEVEGVFECTTASTTITQ